MADNEAKDNEELPDLVDLNWTGSMGAIYCRSSTVRLRPTALNIKAVAELLMASQLGSDRNAFSSFHADTISHSPGEANNGLVVWEDCLLHPVTSLSSQLIRQYLGGLDIDTISCWPLVD